MSDYPMLISNKLHSFRNFIQQRNDIDVTEALQTCIYLVSFLRFSSVECRKFEQEIL